MALDFDGVISDSIQECLVTAFNAYAEFRGLSDFRTDLEKFSDTEIQRFRESRVFIRRGEDYVYLLQAANEKITISSQNQFDEYLQEHELIREKYRTLFYGYRKRLQGENPEKWLALNPLYPGMATFLNKFNDLDMVFIVTTKDLLSVELILSSHGITLAPENMYQATRVYRKPQILQEIIQKRHITPQQLHFIDDHVATVLEVSENTEVNCSCADWGYNTFAQRSELTDHQIPVDSIDIFLNRFT